MQEIHSQKPLVFMQQSALLQSQSPLILPCKSAFSKLEISKIIVRPKERILLHDFFVLHSVPDIWNGSKHKLFQYIYFKTVSFVNLLIIKSLSFSIKSPFVSLTNPVPAGQISHKENKTDPLSFQHIHETQRDSREASPDSVIEL